jgi:uncharacterized repeat protein (TIGR01451 family)
VSGQDVALDNAVIQNNTASSLGDCVYADNDATVTNSAIRANNGHGLLVYGDVSMTGTIVANNSGPGVYVRDRSAVYSRIVNSLLVDNGSPQLLLESDVTQTPATLDLLHSTLVAPNTSAVGVQVANIPAGVVNITNTIIASHTVGLQADSGVIHQDYNLFFGNGSLSSAGGGTVTGGANSRSGSPAFADPASQDYRLTARSAAINQGLDLGIGQDFFGDSRPAGGGVDIGYDETGFALDLQLSKAVQPASALPGQTITYTLAFTAGGSGGVAPNVTLSDPLPISLTNISYSSSLPVTPTGSLSYSWQLPDLTFGDSGVITVTASMSVALTAAGFTNTAAITSTGVESATANNTAAVFLDIGSVAPALVVSTSQTITETQLLTFPVQATDGNNDSVTFSLSNPPAGAIITQTTHAGSTSSGLFSWTPTEGQGPGTYFVSILATDSSGLTATTMVQIAVSELNSAPLLLAPSARTATVAQPLTFSAIGLDGDWPANTLSYSLLDGPGGAVISATSGLFSWTPSAAGVYTTTLQVSDDGAPALTGTAVTTITVNTPALTITKTVTPTTPLPGQAITYTVVVSNSGGGNANGVLVRDTLPAGVSGTNLSRTVTITAGHSQTFVITATVDTNVGYGATIQNSASFSHAVGGGSGSAGFTTVADVAPPDISGVTLITPTGAISHSRRPLFLWTPASDSQSGVVSYTLQLTGSSGATSLLAATTVTSFTPAVDLANGIYTWTVRAHDAAGNMSEYISPTETFEIVASSTGSDTTLFLPIVVKED